MVTTRGGEDMSVQALHPLVHDGPWTWEDLPDREELRGWRAEIVDGGLLLMPPASLLHTVAAFELAKLLSAACADEQRAVAPGSVAYRRTWREPDAMVVRRTGALAGPADPGDVVLVAEVQSPGSVSNDRVVKLHEYASVGIEHYWRVELDPEPLLQAFRLVDGMYVEVVTVRGEGSFTFADPFAVTVSPAALLR